MRVVLTAAVKGLGEVGQVKEVADGYARNYLIPRRLAQAATAGAINQAEARSAADARRRGAEQHDRLALAGRLDSMALTVRSRAGETGRLFGAVTASDIVAALESEAGVKLDKRQIVLEDPLRRVGSHRVAVDLHHGVVAHLNVEIEAAK